MQRTRTAHPNQNRRNWRRRRAPLCGLGLLIVSLAAAPAVWAQQGYGKGKRDAALRVCDELWDRGKRAEARRCYGELARSSADAATQAEALWKLRDFKRANELFRAAVQARPDDPDLRVRWGYLYLETHNPAEAAQLFDEALEIDKDHVPAKLGKASVLARRFEGRALELVNESIEAAPDLIEGYLLRAQMALEEKDLETADQNLDTALEKAQEQKLSPLEIYSLKAAADLLRGSEESEWIQEALRYNPAYGQVYADSAHLYVITRRYREATALYRKAIEVDPELWSAHADLGINLLRLGEEDEGRRHLAIAYEGDPYSAKTVNTLRLLDSFDDFKNYSNKEAVALASEEELLRSVDRPEVHLKLHRKEAEMLKPYVMELAERSIETFSRKYGFTPQEPVKIELYPDHDDFAVRTMGMPGLGLLGVTFGYVVAMDSPTGRSPGSFHWGSTLWHEMAHVFTLEATNHLVPRWFSEGVSMYEEWEAHPSWGERISSDFIQAVKEDRLLPVAELDKGFVRPRYPSQIAVSYLQAGFVCRLIAEQWGFSKLVELLKGYGAGKSTPENFEAVLGVSTEEFDKQFDAYIEEEYGSVVRSYAEWRTQIKQMLAAAREEKWEQVIEFAERARELYPDYVESGNPYVLLSEAYLKSGNKEAAAEVLHSYQKRGGRHPERIKELASLLDELGRREEAIEALQQLIYVAPGDAELHQTLGDWLLEEGRPEEAVREYETILALQPLDLAGAHFNLARTYYRMQDRERTRRHLLAALEVAPSYRPAQKLLLEIVE